MEFRILGSMEVLDEGRRVGLPVGRGRALLGLLVLYAGEVVAADRLIDELWGESSPPTASTVIQGLISKLRKLLEPLRAKGEPGGIIETVGRGYRLAVAPEAVDANRFKRLLDAARLATGERRSTLLANALGLWQGPPLSDFTYDPFAQRAIAALEELRLTAIEEHIDADLALGRHAELIAEIKDLVVAHPFRERLHGQLMLALYRSGRQADALTAFQAARTALVEDLGIEPGPPLRDLETAILRQDSALDSPMPPSQPVPPERTDEEHWLPRERRVVTVLYADLAPTLETDPEARRAAVARSLEVAPGVVHRHGGRFEHVMGDLLVGFFGFPVAHEDDALRAVRAAVELQAAVPSPCRIGVETGELVVGPGGSLAAEASGPAMTLAARLQHAASEGEVLVGASLQRLVRGAAVLKPADAAGAWRVLEVVAGGQPFDARLDVPMVGRTAELTRARAAYSSAARTNTPRLLTLLGEAGIGKSRLSRAFVESIGPAARVITGRCPSYGEGITFLPLREAVLGARGPGGWPALAERLAEVENGAAVATQIAGAIGLTPHVDRPDQLFPAVRQLFEFLATDRPLIAVFEDVHWADSTFLDLLEYIPERARGRIFLLCVARPELLDARPAWGEGALTLEPLKVADTEQLIADRAIRPPPRETLERIVEAAQGNPLFAEQLLATFEEGGLETIPASLRSLLAMRLDRLGPGERDLLRSAAVVGPDFAEEALAALVPEAASPFIDRHLQALEAKQLIAHGDEGLRFRHTLILQAAYQSMTRWDRARLHERFADWLDNEASEPPPELDEIAGYHLEQAVEERRAIGMEDEALAVRAGNRLASAAERALGRLDLPAAERFLSSARSMLPLDHPRRPEVTQHLAEICLPLGYHDRSQELLGEIIEAARAAGDRSAELLARLERGRVQILVGPDPVPMDAFRQEAEEAFVYFTQTGDDSGLGQATFLTAFVEERAGRITAMEDRYRASLAYADRSGLMREKLASRWMLSHALVLGPVPVPECIERCQELVTVHGFDIAGVQMALGLLSAMIGQFDEAREVHDHVRRNIEEQMRVRRLLKFVAVSRAAIEVLAGDLAAAERELRASIEVDRAIGIERDDFAQTAARLAFVLCREGRDEEAAGMAALSANAAPSESPAAQALSTAARARTTGDAELARRAVELAPEEMLNLRADVVVELAAVLRGVGDDQGAKMAHEEAAALYERKGNLAAIALLRAGSPHRQA